MVNKTDKDTESPPAPAAGLFDSRLADAVKESAQQIWLAGMGAFAKAQAEGTKVFESLVKDGVDLQRKTQTAAEQRLSEATGRINTMAAEVSSKAGASWDKLENIFEDRTAKALGRLGVPTAREVAELTRRVDELTLAVAKLSMPAKAPVAKKSAEATPAVTAAPKGTAVKTTATKAPAKKAAGKTAARKKAAPTSPAAADAEG